MNYALLRQNRELNPSKPKIGWLGIWLGALVVMSATIFGSLYFLGPEIGVSPALRSICAWLGISILWVAGLSVILYRYNKLPPQRPAIEEKDWVKRVTLQSNSPKLNNPQPDSDPPAISISNEPPNLEKTLEARARQALTDNQLNIELEIPHGTELEILGEKWKVHKARLRIKTVRTPKQNLENVFSNRRRRVA